MATTVGLDDVFRREWPRILAAVVRYTGSLELAEDAIQEAFVRAAATRERELLVNPAAWVTTVAKRIAIDAIRRDARLANRLPLIAADTFAGSLDASPGDDDRLGLLFVACSPSLSPETRLALALRFVFGAGTETIANAMLVSHAAMSARLTRAKRQIERDGIRFTLPEGGASFDERLTDICGTLYLLYTIGHTAVQGSVLSSSEITSTAIELARAVRRLTPRESESAGLLALLLLTEARAGGRTTQDGAVVSLQEADRSMWDRDLITEGLDLACVALPGGGRFALEAAISGLYSQAPQWTSTNWSAICVLYDGLVSTWPSPAAHLARIVARSHLPGGEDAALDELDRLASNLPHALLNQSIAARADIFRRLRRTIDARDAYIRARAGEKNQSVRAYFGRRIAELYDENSPADGSADGSVDGSVDGSADCSAESGRSHASRTAPAAGEATMGELLAPEGAPRVSGGSGNPDRVRL